MRASFRNISGLVAVVLLVAAGLLTGCQTAGSLNTNPRFIDPLDDGTVASKSASGGTAAANGRSDRLRVGNMVSVSFSDTPAPILAHEERIKEDGTITLPLIGSVTAVGLTPGELQREIRDRYVPKYYVRLTVTVRVADRYYTVDGEVRTPSRQPYVGETSVLGAIASAGGFTDFANKRKVQIIRANGHTETVNCAEALEKTALDLEIYPGDKVIVPRRWF